jgi:uncharacterized membrane protein YphA (DoxX/SURF4 family)
MENLITPEAAAIFFARVLLGILFFMQGYDKVFSLGIRKVVQTIQPSYQRVHIPYPLIFLTAVFTSFVELFGGLFLILGLFKYATLYMLGIDLLIVSLGMSLIDPVWKMDIVLPRFLLLLFVLIVPGDYDVFILDRLLR